ncbi:MAG: hypothetical protein H7641_14300, partial [Candidatus Heimdallarchaeota archaeon]|nr:hypothetical protein [Candidatus Heimdallarchaeota archaeon]MCK4878733.1 hypothetical protein [Candidatus Heimdallarchaeota archaeon]
YHSFISISDIIFSGYIYSLEDLLPANTFKWVEWEGENLDCNFNLNGLKPAGYHLNQILNLRIDYGYIGTTFTSPLIYEIFSGALKLTSRQVEVDELNSNHNSLRIYTWTTNYTETLTLRICGQTEGEGVFYILNTSKIEIEPIPRIKSGYLTRQLVRNFSFQIPLAGSVKLNFQDVFYFTNPNSKELSFYLTYSLSSVENKAATSVRIYLEIDNKVVVDRTVFGQTSTCVDGKLDLTPGIYQVNLTLTIVGPRAIYYLQDLFYQVSVEEPTSSDVPSEFAFDRYVIFLFIWLVISRILVERKERKNIRSYGILEDSASNKVNRWFHSILDWMKMSFVFFPLIFSFLLEYYLPDFYPNIRNFLSFLLGYLVFKLVSKLEKRKYRAVTRARRIPNMRNLSFTDELSSSRNWLLLDLGRIPRIFIGLSVIAFFTLSTPIFSLFLSKANEIVFTIWNPEHFRFGQLGSYLMIISIILGIFSCIFALRLALSLPFVEDNLLKFMLVGVPSGIGLSVSWGLLYVFISKNTLLIDFKIYLTLVLPISFLIIIISCIVLGTVKTKQHNIIFSYFVLSGKLKTGFQAYQQAIVDKKSSRFDYRPYHLEEHRDALEETITTKLEPEKPISLRRLAMLANVPYNFAEEPLLDLLEEKPELGIYFKEKKKFLPSLADKRKSKSDFDAITARIETAREIAARDEPPVIFEEDINEEELNLEMKKTVKEYFQELYGSVKGENEEKKKAYLKEEYNLTSKETTTYLTFLKRGIGDKESIFTNADREFLQRAWKKIHVTKDIFQRNSPKNLMKEYYDKLSRGHNGFDDVVFIKKRRRRFKITFLDYKTGDPSV